MFTCPLFHEFCELIKTAKLKGVNIDNVPTSIGIVCCIGIVWFKFAKIILHVKLPTFRLGLQDEKVL